MVSFLKKLKKPYSVIDYLKYPLKKEDLVYVSKNLKMRPFDFTRKTNPKVKKELVGINQNNDYIVIGLVLKYPIALERPIVIFGDRAVIGRPYENIYNLF